MARTSSGPGTLEIAAEGWGNWTILPSPIVVTLEQMALTFDYQAGAASGSISAQLSVLGAAAVLSLKLPGTVLTGSIATGQLNLQRLCNYVLGKDVALPGFLQDIGLLETDVSLDFAKQVYELQADLAENVDMGAAGTLDSVSAVARVTTDPSKQTVCLQATWTPPGSSSGVPGQYCWPFEEFCPESGSCEDFPPKEQPDPDPPPRPSVDPITNLVAGLAAAGSSILWAASQGKHKGGSAREVGAGLLNGTGAGNSGGSGPTLAELEQIVQALEQLYGDEYGDNPTALVGDLIQDNGGKAPDLNNMATALSFGGYAAPGATAALAKYYPVGLDTLAAALAEAAYTLPSCAPPLATAFPQAGAVQLAKALAAAGFAPAPQPPAMLAALEDAGFDLGAALQGVAAAFARFTVDDAANLLAMEGDSVTVAAAALADVYPPAATAQALTASAVYGPAVGDALALARVLVGAYGSGMELDGLTGALAACGYAPYTTSAAVTVAYPIPSPWSPFQTSWLAAALISAYSDLTLLQLAVALAATGMPEDSLEAGLAPLNAPPSLIAAISELVTTTYFLGILHDTDAARSAGCTVREAALAVSAAYPDASATLVVALACVFPTVEALVWADAACRTTAGRALGRVGEGLLMAAPDSTPETLTRELAFAQPGDGAPSPGLIAGAMVSAFRAIGGSVDADDLASALAAIWIEARWPLPPVALAQAVFDAFGGLSANALAQALAAAGVALDGAAEGLHTVLPSLSAADFITALVTAFKASQPASALGIASVCLDADYAPGAALGAMAGPPGDYFSWPVATAAVTEVYLLAPAHILFSPLVGTFYRAPSPGGDPLVEVGSQVRRGQVVCIIEAMKIMHEIESDVDGVIAEIYPYNAQAVESGEPLFIIRT